MDGNLIVSQAPRAPRKLQDTRLNRPNLLRLALKHCHLRGIESGADLAAGLGLRFAIANELLNEAKDKQLVEIRGAAGGGYGDFVYALTTKGREWADDAAQRNQYVGPAPVTLADYCAQVERQRIQGDTATPENLATNLADLVLSGNLTRRIGPALNAGRSILFYGAPGNGKTSVAERISTTFAGAVYLPYAIEVDGQIIKVFDPMVHHPVAVDDTPAPSNGALVDDNDGRWVACRRPIVTVGGELTMDALELKHSPSSGLHEAPLQLKANGGIFILDDLGRQRVDAKDLLNRWIIPMERGIDYLTLNIGTTIEVPFDSLLIFSTNLEPARLMDPAFLRRIPYKIEMRPPTEDQYREAFGAACTVADLAITDDHLDYILREVQTTHAQPLAFYQVGFIVEQILAAAAFEGHAPEVRQDLLDDALQNLSALPS